MSGVKISNSVFILIMWILGVAGFVAMGFWLAPLNGDIVKTGHAITIGGYEGSYMTVESASPVCATGVSQYSGFTVITPSAVFEPTMRAGNYFIGTGCFNPGKWGFYKNPPVLTLESDSEIHAVSYSTPEARRSVWILILGCVIIYGLLMLWLYLRQRTLEKYVSEDQ